MDVGKALLILVAAACLATPAQAQFPGNETGGGGGGGSSSTEQEKPKQEEKVEDKQSDSSQNEPSNAQPMPTELDYPIEEKIKMKVDPVMPGSLVDRITQPTVVIVESPGASAAEIFVVPVDAPYGGKAIDKPHSIGKDMRPSDGLKVMWTGKERFPYVKIFAVIDRPSGNPRRVRSHTMDFGMAGARLEAKSGTP